MFDLDDNTKDNYLANRHDRIIDITGISTMWWRKCVCPKYGHWINVVSNI